MLLAEEAGVAVERFVGCDPYTGEAYRRRVGRPCLPYSWDDVAGGCLDADDCGEGGGGDGDVPSPSPRFALCVCSFALHLCDASRLPGTLTALARSCRVLLLLAPHKLPPIRCPGWGWTEGGDFTFPAAGRTGGRVRARLFFSNVWR